MKDEVRITSENWFLPDGTRFDNERRFAAMVKERLELSVDTEERTRTVKAILEENGAIEGHTCRLRIDTDAIVNAVLKKIG